MMSAPAFSLDAYLATHRARVETLLLDRLDRLADRAPVRLLDAMRYSLMAGGKRLRPLLCFAFTEAIGGARALEQTITEDAACALEWVHTYSLIHDDLPSMDNDDLRRGKPTSHKVFGEAMAILAGDALLTEAFNLLLSGSETARPALARELAQASGALGMVGGQVLDIAENRPAEEAYLIRLHSLKTGALIRAACRMGVICGGGSATQMESARTYGDAVGLAFQIADDLLDVTAEKSTLGKPVGADAEAGRFTFPSVVGLRKSEALARERIEHALAALVGIESPPRALAGLARYSVERKT